MEIPLLVLETAGRLRKAATVLFREHALSPAQFNVLNLLADQPAGMRAGDLANQLVVDPSNVTGLLSRLVAEGLVVDSEAPEDRRSRVVKLTAKGRARRAEGARALRPRARPGAGGAHARERAAAERVLNKLLAARDALVD